MAMYYQGSSEIQPDTLQTLYLMNPNYVGFSDSTQSQSNMLFFSSAPTTAAAAAVHGLNAPPQFVGLPQSHGLGNQENISAPRLQYNIWSLIDQSANVSQSSNTNQTLALSLSAAESGGGSLKPLPASDFQDLRGAWRKNSNGGNTMQSVIMGSKYLKAAQELLDEVAHVGKGNEKDRNKAKLAKESNCADTTAAAACGGGEIGEKSGGGHELTTAQRQEIQMKKAKLSTMLEEVEQRYREYHQQMQMVVASFEQAAGIGAAKSYTQLALKTILRQFRCLKCTISAQIRGLCRSLGEDDQTRFVEHHQLRQQKALQQLGMMHNSNAWRPQRGLPERAVSVLRAWLFEHFLHPYPKDSDKQMLAKQTGLTRSQVSNWFINARVRLWKPMVEEMYLEEMKTQEQSTKPGLDTSESPNSKFNPGPEIDNHLNAALQSHQRKLVLNLTENISANSPTGSSLQPRPGFSRLFTSVKTKTLPEKNPKKPRNENQDNSPSSILSGADMDMKAVGDLTSKGFMMDNNVKFGNARESYLSMAADIGDHQQMASMGFNFQGNNNSSSNNFSLSLALPPSETSSQGARLQNFLSHRKFHEFGTRIAQSGVESSGINNQAAAGYEILDFQNRKPYPEIII